MQPWFQCDCGETLKKPKVLQHANMCGAHFFTCIDCSRQFDRNTVVGHTRCVTEHEKYAQGATKPGGYASKGFYDDSDGNAKNKNGNGGSGQESEAEGLEFLTTRAPWKCTICNVACTSQETLLSHAQGAKHRRRSRAAIKSRSEEKKEEEKKEEGNENQKNDDDDDTNEEEENTKQKKSKKESSKKKSDKKIKWKKLAANELKKNGGSMKIKKLISSLKTDLKNNQEYADFIEGDGVLNILKKKKKLFAVEGKIVTLVGGK